MDKNYKYVIDVCYRYEHKLIYLNDNSAEAFLNECKSKTSALVSIGDDKYSLHYAFTFSRWKSFQDTL